MAVINGPQGTPAQAPAQAKSPEQIEAELKAKRAKAVVKFRENRERRRKETYESALKLRDELVKASVFDKLTDTAKNFVLTLCINPAEKKAAPGTLGGPSVFTQLFGMAPTVGQRITLEEAFNKTYKGESTINMWIKRWADKGIIVEYTPNTQKKLQSVYTIKALPKAA